LTRRHRGLRTGARPRRPGVVVGGPRRRGHIWNQDNSVRGDGGEGACLDGSGPHPVLFDAMARVEARRGCPDSRYDPFGPPRPRAGVPLAPLAAIGSASYSGAETGKLSDATGSDFTPVAGSARAGLLQRSPQAAPRQRLPIANAGKASLGMPFASYLAPPTPEPVDVVEVIPTLRGFRPPGGNQVPPPPHR
jgi:hypothetical protein